MSLYNLVLQREVLDTQIRAMRVRIIRESVASKLKLPITQPTKFRQACAVLEEIESHIVRVYYTKVKVDDLLDQAEAMLDIIDGPL